MQVDDRRDGLVVATPERVAFEYTVAGLGSRFMAQAIDVMILAVVFTVLTIVVGVLGVFGAGNLVVLIYVLLSFLLVVLYFPVQEGVWSGQTIGKRLLRLRVLGDRGEPVTVTQVAIRNLIRIVDFLPVFYGIGIVTLFIQGGSKRLGDFAAGTVVVRDRDRVRLKDLVSHPAPVAAAGPEPAPSIWAAATTAAAPGPPPLSSMKTTTPYEDAAGRMPDALRRFVVAYAGRRYQLAEARRQQLADQAAGPLRALLPVEVDAFGPLAVLEGMAGLMYTPTAPQSTLPPPSGLPPPSPILPPGTPPPSPILPPAEPPPSGSPPPV
ncbi:MAG TPA: RDD family protein [Candidatus Solibacter sp.]|jgi:uncharacterized RDD family membrane protein YckC|nr:RDD family protein [Candidatus Solibacter sp.]